MEFHKVMDIESKLLTFSFDTDNVYSEVTVSIPGVFFIGDRSKLTLLDSKEEKTTLGWVLCAVGAHLSGLATIISLLGKQHKSLVCINCINTYYCIEQLLNLVSDKERQRFLSILLATDRGQCS